MIKDKMKICPNCLKNIQEDSMVCSYCGILIKHQEQFNILKQICPEGTRYKSFSYYYLIYILAVFIVIIVTLILSNPLAALCMAIMAVIFILLIMLTQFINGLMSNNN